MTSWQCNAASSVSRVGHKDREASSQSPQASVLFSWVMTMRILFSQVASLLKCGRKTVSSNCNSPPCFPLPQPCSSSVHLQEDMGASCDGFLLLTPRDQFGRAWGETLTLASMCPPQFRSPETTKEHQRAWQPSQATEVHIGPHWVTSPHWYVHDPSADSHLAQSVDTVRWTAGIDTAFGSQRMGRGQTGPSPNSEINV